MGRYDDVLDFLARHEDENETEMNSRKVLSPEELQGIRTQYSGVPDDYIDYLAEVGFGAFRECQYAVLSGFIEPSDIFDAETVGSLGKRVLCFGDNFTGDPGGFLPDDGWKVVEILHESIEIHDTGKPFGAFIRNQMLMDEQGNDMRK
ncbi:MAG: hypothetical protein HN849_25550 [Victivallales bacterium]|jgi:hypothetical protein|nr:hypothetical protein [Victivallales bacterium]MBT7302923.1 hypothetical protein [Victivallales bacterium]